MTNKQQRIAALEAEIKKIMEEKDPVNWRAVKGGYYFSVDSYGFITEQIETGHHSDDYRYNTLNYHQTQEQAEAYKEYLLALVAVTRRIWEENGDWKEDWTDNRQMKYNIRFNYPKEILEWYGIAVYKDITVLPWIKSLEIAEKIISECAKEFDIIRKYR